MRERVFIAICIWVFSLPGTLPLAFAQPPGYSREEAQIPKTPSTPPQLEHAGPPTDPFRCERYFKYKGKVISCDSNIRLDAEQLRPIMESVPAAVAELDAYQHNRAKVRTAAYVGSVGLFTMIGGALWSLHYRENGSATDTSIAVRNASLIGGGAIVFASFLSALSFIKSNEEHLGNAVIRYNEAHPEAPIELLFTTGIHF